MSDLEPKTALIIGAPGGVGGAAARALLARGWRVRALNRDPSAAAARAPGLERAEWVAGDAMNPAEVAAAAEGVEVIVHGANPPAYRNWKALVLPMLDSTIAAARAAGARIVFPGTVYNFGPETFPMVDERAPQAPRTRKGAIRVEMERRLRAAAEDGVRTVVLRCGDFFGPHAANNWFSQGLVSPGRAVRSVSYPGDFEVGHAWAYLPDVGETMARLIELDEVLAPFAAFHMRGHWLERGVEMAEAVRRVAGRPEAPIRSVPWAAIGLLAPFNETFREMLEMRYLWRAPLRLDNARLAALLGEEPHTPLDAAVRTTLEAMDCLSPAPAMAA